MITLNITATQQSEAIKSALSAAPTLAFDVNTIVQVGNNGLILTVNHAPTDAEKTAIATAYLQELLTFSVTE